VRISAGEYRDVIIVPERAVIEGQGGPTVYVVDPKDGNKVKVVRVEPIDVYRGMRVIKAGLQPGQKVIVEGLQLVRPEQEVKVEEAPLDQFFRPETDADLDERFDSEIISTRSEPEKARPRPSPSPGGPSRPEPAAEGRSRAAEDRAAPPPKPR
jgi:hypothetical protein